ncbi:hypothetical protein AX17_006733 [Amanita inopinata Kibby_2008]|nr:hypothetical protein AX17_006733 [Amanita inopinata Kibby_2008]
MHLFTRPFSSVRAALSYGQHSRKADLSKHAFKMKYITGDELAEIIKSNRIPSKDYLVVDVRDDDYVGGNIKHALNRPSGGFLEIVDDLVKSAKDIPLIVFHCSLSQMRGPKAARIYEETRRNILDEDAEPQEIVILRDGFSQFQIKFKARR